MIKYNGVNHLAMVTGDMDKTIRFWRDLLGMRLVAGLGRPGYRHYFLEISETDLIAFFEWEGVSAIEEVDHGTPRRGGLVFDHVSFGVEEEGMLWELKDKLEAAGFWASEIIDHGFIHSLYSFDPNGIPIEFSFQVAGVLPAGSVLDRLRVLHEPPEAPLVKAFQADDLKGLPEAVALPADQAIDHFSPCSQPGDQLGDPFAAVPLPLEVGGQGVDQGVNEGRQLGPTLKGPQPTEVIGFQTLQDKEVGLVGLARVRKAAAADGLDPAQGFGRR